MTTDIKTVWDVNALLGDWQTGNGGLLEVMTCRRLFC